MQTAAMDPKDLIVPGAEHSARRAQAAMFGKIAFGATALFAAQLYLSPAQWLPELEPLHHAAVLSVLGLGALMVRRVITNQPLWMGWRTALLVFVGVATLLILQWLVRV